MSADKWAICPRCKQRQNKIAKDHSKRMREAYGKVTRDEYERMKNVEALPPLEETLRQDYEIGIYDGEFYVSYEAICNACDFTFSFKHKEDLEVDDEQTTEAG